MAKSKFMMWRHFAMAAAMIVAVQVVPASADTIDLSKIPKDQAEQIRKLVNDATPSDEAIKAQELGKRVDHFRELGRNLAVSYKATAEELGMDEKTFSETSFGKFSYFWIAWELWFKDTGNTIANVSLGLLWWFLSFGIWLYAFQKICMVKSKRREVIQRRYTNDMGQQVVDDVTADVVELHDISDGDVAGYRFVFLCIAIIIAIPGFVLIS